MESFVTYMGLKYIQNIRGKDYKPNKWGTGDGAIRLHCKIGLEIMNIRNSINATIDAKGLR